jgi:hypothetical protein
VSIALDHSQCARVDPVAIFRARVEAVSLRFAIGDAGLAELLDGIEAAAGQFVAAVKVRFREAPLSKSFAAACRKADAEARSQRRHALEPIPLVATHGVPGADRLQVEYERSIERAHARELPTATQQAAEYLDCEVREHRPDAPARLRAWLDQHSPREVLAITKHIKKREASNARDK